MDWLITASDRLMNVSICEYNPTIILLGLAFMAIFWFLAHCVKCKRVARKMANDVIANAGRRFDDTRFHSASSDPRVSLYKK